jgi:3-oxo-5alpha-steroid 4-dehydrogenase
VAEYWDERADVVVVGLGAAGACAAIEAAEAGADVLVLDRFGGGGASALSGGVVYAGAGTQVQDEAGVTDTVEAMYEYLSREVGDAVSPATLRRFCAGSPAMITWLAQRGVPFEGSLCPYKTSYPTNSHYLYHSGSELSGSGTAAPAPRGHRARGRGTSGSLLYARLAATARARGVRVFTQTSAVHLRTDTTGRVIGVEGRTLRSAPGWARVAHRMLHRVSVMPGLYAPALGRALHRPVAALERRHGRPLRIAADRGVVLSAGGFVLNRHMLREHAPTYRGGLPLGTPGDDGSGIRLGVGAGAVTDRMDRVTIWRFLNPPAALLRGILVDRAGRRICDESRYGAAIGDAVLRSDQAKAWLLVDRTILTDARRQTRAQTLWFQRIQAWFLFRLERVCAATVPAVAVRAGVDPGGLEATVTAYHAAIAAGAPDPAGKPPELVRPLDHPPYSLIDCSIRGRPMHPAPMLTLGGLVVAEESGQARRADGTVVPGLFAAGRTAVGICSNSYVSGLSLADCVFSGRRAGRHAATGDGPPRPAAARSTRYPHEAPPSTRSTE